MSLASAPDPTLASFYGQPWWMIVLKVVVIAAAVALALKYFGVW